MKDKTARKRSTAAVNRILTAHRTLKGQLVKLAPTEREMALKTLSDSTAELAKFVNAQSAPPLEFSFVAEEEASE